jgi:hypothetical protein
MARWGVAMGWWSRFFGRKPPERAPGPTASWLPADGNPFGVPVLDLISITGNLVSTTRNPAEAAMAISWSNRLVADLALDCAVAESLTCVLRHPAAPDLADGWLYLPPAMEQKWAIAYRTHAIYLIRSSPRGSRTVAEQGDFQGTGGDRSGGR